MKCTLVDIVEVGKDYTERLITIRTSEHCTVKDAQNIAKDAGYQVIDDIYTTVDTMHEVQITVAVEPEYV